MSALTSVRRPQPGGAKLARVQGDAARAEPVLRACCARAGREPQKGRGDALAAKQAVGPRPPRAAGATGARPHPPRRPPHKPTHTPRPPHASAPLLCSLPQPRSRLPGGVCAPACFLASTRCKDARPPCCLCGCVWGVQERRDAQAALEHSGGTVRALLGYAQVTVGIMNFSTEEVSSLLFLWFA